MDKPTVNILDSLIGHYGKIKSNLVIGEKIICTTKSGKVHEGKLLDVFDGWAALQDCDNSLINVHVLNIQDLATEGVNI